MWWKVMKNLWMFCRVYAEVTDGQPNAQLYIVGLQREDAGEYVCVGDFPGHDQLRATSTIEVYQDIKFVDAPEVQNPVSGEDGKIKCEVSGNPAPEVDWLRDGKPMAVSEYTLRPATDWKYLLGLCD